MPSDYYLSVDEIPHRFPLSLDKRIELFTYAVSYAKSHPSSDFGRQETAVEFLTDLEEKLEVAQVQHEIYNELLPRIGRIDAPDAAKVRRLGEQLMTISEVSLLWSNCVSSLKMSSVVPRIC